jgi:hypothetical protein
MADTKTAAKADFTLVVIHPFGDYERGARIDDAAAVDAVLNGENASHVVKVAAQ